MSVTMLLGISLETSLKMGIFFDGRVGTWVSQLWKQQFIYFPGVWICFSRSVFCLFRTNGWTVYCWQMERNLSCLNISILMLTVSLRELTVQRILVLKPFKLFSMLLSFTVYLSSFCLSSKYTCKHFTLWKNYWSLKAKCLELGTSFCSWQSFELLNSGRGVTHVFKILSVCYFFWETLSKQSS